VTIFSFLTRLSEAGDGAILTGAAAEPYRGPTFERLLRQGTLVEKAPLREWDVCDRCECGLASRSVRFRGERYVAACPLDAQADENLDATDLKQFRIVQAELVAAIGKLAGFQSRPSELTAGVWLLGELPSGRIVVLAFERHRLETDGFVQIIRSAAKGRPTTMLAPDMSPGLSRRFKEADIHIVSAMRVLDSTTGPHIKAAVLEPEPEAAQLLVDVRSGRVVWLDRTVELSHQLFPVFLRLAEQAKTARPLLSGPQLEGATGREAKDLVRELRRAFQAAGLPKEACSDLILSVRNRGYRLAIAQEAILIRGEACAEN
jgi:hypothetical protein